MAYIPSQDDQMRRRRVALINEQIANIEAMLPQLEAADAAYRKREDPYGRNKTFRGDAHVARDNLKHLHEERIRHCCHLHLPLPPAPTGMGSAT